MAMVRPVRGRPARGLRILGTWATTGRASFRGGHMAGCLLLHYTRYGVRAGHLRAMHSGALRCPAPEQRRSRAWGIGCASCPGVGRRISGRDGAASHYCCFVAQPVASGAALRLALLIRLGARRSERHRESVTAAPSHFPLNAAAQQLHQSLCLHKPQLRPLTPARPGTRSWLPSPPQAWFGGWKGAPPSQPASAAPRALAP